MTQDSKVVLSIGLLTVLVLVGVVLFGGKSATPKNSASADPSLLIREDSHKISADSDKVTLVEFADFQCPACAAQHPILKQLLNDYKGRINFVFRHFPLPSHANARISAEAAEAANEQGKFWEMHDKLYEHQDDWSESKTPIDIFVGYAQELGLDTNQFRQALESHKYAERVNKDVKDGDILGVNATPTLYLNNQQLKGVLSYPNLKDKVDAELNK